MAWALLGIAGVLEIAFAFGLKSSEGFTRLIPALFTVATGLSSVVLLSLALRSLVKWRPAEAVESVLHSAPGTPPLSLSEKSGGVLILFKPALPPEGTRHALRHGASAVLRLRSCSGLAAVLHSLMA